MKLRDIQVEGSRPRLYIGDIVHSSSDEEICILGVYSFEHNDIVYHPHTGDISLEEELGANIFPSIINCIRSSVKLYPEQYEDDILIFVKIIRDEYSGFISWEDTLGENFSNILVLTATEFCNYIEGV